MSAIFSTSKEQYRQALSSKKEEERRLGTELYTEIVPAGPFYPAEDYHQKYTLRRYPDFMEELVKRFGSDESAVVSTPAARLNGYLAGYGGCETVRSNVESLGLPAHLAERVVEIACGISPRETCPVP